MRYELEDISEAVSDLCGAADEDPTAKIDKIEGRLDAIAKLKRKYGSTVEEILKFKADAEALVSSHEGEEFIIVVSGEIELLYGEDVKLLGPGDSAYYNSVVKHRVRAANGKPATIYACIFMPFN